MAFDFDGDKYQQASRHQKEWGNKVISGLELRGTETVLDLGCGDGVLTGQLAQIVPDGKALGIDASPGMIKTARQQSGHNLFFICGDINDIDFMNEFDLIFSNAALHWVKDHRSLLRNCKKALKPGGAIRWSFGGFGNCSNLNEIFKLSIGLPEYKDFFAGFDWPWYMPDEKEYTKLVEASGFDAFEISIENADRFFSNSEEMIKWIDQPCIVPFLDYLKDEKTKIEFRNTVITRMIEQTLCNDGTYFETFRRLNVTAW